MVVPYTKGHSKSFKNICGKVGVQVHFKGGNTIRSLMATPKDKDKITQKSGVIYKLKYTHASCEEEHLGVSVWTFGERFKEHLRVPFPHL